MDDIVSMCTRYLEPKDRFNAIQKRSGRLFIDADSAIALDIGVAADWDEPRTRPADIAGLRLERPDNPRPRESAPR